MNHLTRREQLMLGLVLGVVLTVFMVRTIRASHPATVNIESIDR